MGKNKEFVKEIIEENTAFADKKILLGNEEILSPYVNVRAKGKVVDYSEKYEQTFYDILVEEKDYFMGDKQ